jgi:glycosyltransferase involved in cell wall biosynthesis
MRILHVVPAIDPALGGPPEIMSRLSDAMVRVGVRSDVLSLETPKDEWRANWSVDFKSIGHTFGKYRYTRGLRPWLKVNRDAYDAILVHGVWQYHGLGVWRAFRDGGVPFFLFPHGMLDPWFGRTYPLKHIKKTIYWRLFEHRILRDATTVLFTSAAEARLTAQSFRPYRCKGQVVGLGTAEPPADVRSQLDAFYSAFGHLRARRIVLFLGRLHKKKGCDLLLQAFAATAVLDPRLHLVVAGPDEDGLRDGFQKFVNERRIQDRITFTGELRSSAKWGAFRAAEAFALTSHGESYGNAVVEAMACGLPVLISDKVNISEEIASDRAGLIDSDTVEGSIRLLQRWAPLVSARGKRSEPTHATVMKLATR